MTILGNDRTFVTMAYDENLADRIRDILDRQRVHYEERRMMGGLCFMVHGKMCMGVEKDKLMARIGPEVYPEALKRKGCREMDFTGKPMKGYVYVLSQGFAEENDLAAWVQLCLDFNPLAVASVKAKKK
ncbi:MAG TPA: TfoX/Sxy family protein [Flavobacteriales bacterium]|nr:TfoX/Sxy family protein [Flavobacteriales bacterium]